MATLCVWTCSPGAIAAVAKPMIWLYLRTASPAATGTVASLCPAGTWPRLVTRSPGISVPGRISARATTTLSAPLSRMVSLGIECSDFWRRDQFTGGSPAWQFLPPIRSRHGWTARRQDRGGDGGSARDRPRLGARLCPRRRPRDRDGPEPGEAGRARERAGRLRHRRPQARRDRQRRHHYACQ